MRFHQSFIGETNTACRKNSNLSRVYLVAPNMHCYLFWTEDFWAVNFYSVGQELLTDGTLSLRGGSEKSALVISYSLDLLVRSRRRDTDRSRLML